MTESTADQIAKGLGEADELPRKQIAGVVEALGEERALALLADVERIEQNGGMMVPDGSRRRSPGGVFFLLARQELDPTTRKRLFGKSSKPTSQKLPPKPPPRARVIEVSELGGTAPPGKPAVAGVEELKKRFRAELVRLDSESRVKVLCELLEEVAKGKLGG